MCCEAVSSAISRKEGNRNSRGITKSSKISYRKFPLHLIFCSSGILVRMVWISEIEQLWEFPKTLQGVWGEYLESSRSNDNGETPTWHFFPRTRAPLASRLVPFEQLLTFKTTYCGSRNLKQVLPFWATFEQHVGLEKKSTISSKSRLRVVCFCSWNPPRAELSGY